MFSAQPEASCQKQSSGGRKTWEEENMEEVQRKGDQERQHVRPVWMSSEAKVGDHGHGDRLCPVDKAHQQRHWENDTSSSLKSLIFPSQGAWRLHKKETMLSSLTKADIATLDLSKSICSHDELVHEKVVFFNKMLCYQPLWTKLWTSMPPLPWKRVTQEELISSQILFWNHPAVVTTCLAVNVIQVLQEIWKSVTIQSSRFFIDIHNHLSQVLLRNFSKAFFKSFSFYMKHQTQTAQTTQKTHVTSNKDNKGCTVHNVTTWLSCHFHWCHELNFSNRFRNYFTIV